MWKCKGASLNANSEADCYMRCHNSSTIPCTSKNDCSMDNMNIFCKQDEIVFKNGFIGYCGQGFCMAFGCGGTPAIN